MKRILLFLLVIVLSITILGCGPNVTDATKQMNRLPEAEKINNYWVSHAIILNDQDTLYYASKTFRRDTEVYVNPKEIFFLARRVTIAGIFGSVSFTELSLKDVMEILNERTP
jgi:hypothetical protein